MLLLAIALLKHLHLCTSVFQLTHYCQHCFSTAFFPKNRASRFTVITFSDPPATEFFCAIVVATKIVHLIYFNKKGHKVIVSFSFSWQ